MTEVCRIKNDGEAEGGAGQEAGRGGRCLARAASQQSVFVHQPSRTTHSHPPPLSPRAHQPPRRHSQRRGAHYSGLVTVWWPPETVTSLGSAALVMKVSVLLLLLLLALRAGGEPPRSHLRQRVNSRGLRLRPQGRSYRMMAEQASHTRTGNRLGHVRCGGSEEQVRRALHVITARVEHVGVFTTRLRVRRVLKGAALPHIIIISTCTVACCTLHRRDTRLFLLGRPESAGDEDVFPQVAPPLTITVKTMGLLKGR